MKIAVYNIFLTVWVLFSLGMGCFLSYQGIVHFNHNADFTALTFFLIFIVLTASALVFIVYRLRVVVICKDRIIELSIFSFKKVRIDFNNIKKISWGHFNNKAIYHLTLEIMSNDGRKISLSDFEFENFKTIANLLSQNTRYEAPQKLYLDQANANNSLNIWIFIMIIALVAEVFFQAKTRDFDWFSLLVTVTLLLLLLSTIRRWRVFRNVL